MARTRIALVEDEAPVRVALDRLLRLADYEVLAYDSGEQFLSGLADGLPDCALLDVHLPGLTGLDVHRQLQSRHVHLPVVFITASEDPAIDREAREAGCSRVLRKPFSSDELFASIATAMRRAASPAPPALPCDVFPAESTSGATAMKKSRAWSIAFAASAGAWFSTAAAMDPIPDTPGWRGFAVVGVGYTEVKTNLLAGNAVVEIGRETISSINQSPRSDSATHPVFTGEINYTTAGRWQVFLGTSLEDALTLDGAGQFGVRKDAGSTGAFQAGFLFNSVTTKVWEDPYAEGVVRQDTDRDSTGARLQWDRVLGSAFQLTLSYRDISIDNEASGRGVRTATCNAACQGLLRRDGDQLTFDVSYLYRIGNRNLFRPQFRYRVDDRDGAAISNDFYSLLLSHVFLGQGYTLATNAVYGQRKYDERNPIFGRKTDEDRYALDTTLLYRLPFGGGRWQAVGSATWGRDDSDVRFHDSDVFNISVGAMYRFGN